MKVPNPTLAINRLTPDEDEQQELWVRYLEDGSGDITALSIHLANIRKAFSDDQLLQITLWRRVYSAPQRLLLDLFDQFTEVEQSIMRLLALGASLEEISSIINISVIRLRHAISVIREHEAWSKFNGT